MSAYTDAVITALEQRKTESAYTPAQAEAAYAPHQYFSQGALSALATLSEREQEVMRLRYAESLTLDKIGKALDVSRERVRQIETKALAKLNHPSRQAMMRCVPYEDYRQLLNEIAKQEQDIAWLKSTIDALSVQIEPVSVSVPLTHEWADAMNTGIEELLLTVRSYNCLCRAKARTIGDVLKLSLDDMMNIRNLGMKSIEEVIAALHKRGLCPAIEDIREAASVPIGRVEL